MVTKTQAKIALCGHHTCTGQAQANAHAQTKKSHTHTQASQNTFTRTSHAIHTHACSWAIGCKVTHIDTQKYIHMETHGDTVTYKEARTRILEKYTHADAYISISPSLTHSCTRAHTHPYQI